MYTPFTSTSCKTHPPVLNTNGFPRSVVSAPVYEAEPEEVNLSTGILMYKLQKMGIELDDFAPGQYNSLVCSVCKGGDSEEKSFSLLISPDGYGESVDWMTVEELEQGKRWLNETFYRIRCEDDALPNIKWVLMLAKAAVMRHGVRGLVIDPYNELDISIPLACDWMEVLKNRSAIRALFSIETPLILVTNLRSGSKNVRVHCAFNLFLVEAVSGVMGSDARTETEYVSQMLMLVKRFAQHHCCHVWFVAHPRQLHHWVGSPPNLYDISGSAHFINKCDNGTVIHRNRDPDAGPMDQVQVCVRKVRNKVMGTIGDGFLTYNSLAGQPVNIWMSINQLKSNHQDLKGGLKENRQSVIIHYLFLSQENHVYSVE